MHNFATCVSGFIDRLIDLGRQLDIQKADIQKDIQPEKQIDRCTKLEGDIKL